MPRYVKMFWIVVSKALPTKFGVPPTVGIELQLSYVMVPNPYMSSLIAKSSAYLWAVATDVSLLVKYVAASVPDGS